MATVYVDGALGSDSNTYVQAQSALTPWLTIGKPIASATAGDSVTIADGTYVAPAAPGYFSFTKCLLNNAANSQQVVWRADSGHSSYTARISSSAAAGTLTFNGINFDCESRVSMGFEIGQDDVDDWTTNITSCVTTSPTQRGLNIFARRGTVK